MSFAEENISAKEERITGGWRKLHKEELHDTLFTAVAMQLQRDGRIYKAVSGQQLGKHVPIARHVQQLDHNNGNGVFSIWSVPRCYEQDSLKQRVHLRDSD
jgi:hypothetical protein